MIAFWEYREYRSNIEILSNSEKYFKALEVKANNQRKGILPYYGDKMEKKLSLL